MPSEAASAAAAVNPGFRQNLRDLRGYLKAAVFANATVAWLWGASGPLLITLAAARQGNLPHAYVVSWVFAIYVVGGTMSVLLSLMYRQPIVGAFTIPAVVLVGAALGHLPFRQAVAAYWLAGALIALLGATGVIRSVLNRIPLPIMMGMVAGVLIPFAVAIIRGLQQAPLLCSIPVAAFLAVSMAPALRKIPPVLASIVAGIVGASVLHQANWAGFSFALARPLWIAPEFTGTAVAELVIPLVLIVVAAQNIQGFAALAAAGYQPPLTALTVATGAGTLASAGLGGVPACIAGPSTAIVAARSSGAIEGRYAASIVLGVLWIVTGLLAPAAAAITGIVPKALVDVLGGLALLGALAQFFTQAFGAAFRFGALVAFLVTISGVTLSNIAAPFWALVAGVGASLAFERGDFSRPKEVG